MATLTSTKIKNTYDALLKSIDNDAIGTTAKQITDGLGNTTPLYISTTQVGIGVTPESGLNLHVFGDAKIGSNLTVIGNLVVEGSTTTVGTDTLTVKDPLIVLANNNTSTDAVDIGFYGKYTPSGTTLYSGLFREALTGKYRLFKDLQEEPTTTVNTSGTGYTKADLVIGALEATTGTFSGNVDIDGTLDVDDVISVEGSAFGRIEIGGASGGYVDLKAPNSDDYDLRLITSVGGAELLSIDTLKFYTGATTDLAFTIDASQNATFENNVTIPETPTADTHAASKGYVDAAVEGQDTLAEILAIGNTTGGTDIAVSSNDDITFADNSKIILGDGSDVEIYWDNFFFQIDSSLVQGGTRFVTNNLVLVSNQTIFDLNQAVQKYYSGGNEKFRIYSDGIKVYGNIESNNGTASSPAYSFDVDDNIGMYRSGADELSFSTSGTQRLVIDSSGNIGVNTSTPSDYTADELVISVPDGSGMTLVSGTTDAAYITFMSSTGAIATNGGYIGYDHDADGLTMFAQSKVSIAILEAEVAYFTDTAFYVDKSTTIDDNLSVSDDLGVGISVPLYKLDVVSSAADTARFTSTSSTTTNVYIGNSNATANNTANLYFMPANNIAGSYIKSTAIEDFSTAANRTSDLRFGVRKDGTFNEAVIIDSSGDVSVLKTDSSTYSSTTPVADLILSRKNTGNTNNETVGIRFDVTGWSGSTTGGAAIEAIQPSNASSADLAFLTRNAGTWGEKMRIDSSGNVTIGTGIINPSIGGDIAITQGAIGLRINDAASAISPTTATANNDNAVDLGVSNIRFRNLYMGGNGTFGGSVTIDSSTATLNLTGSNTGASLINFADSDDGNVGRIYYDHTNNFMQFKTNDSESMRITSGGSVLIDTTDDTPNSVTTSAYLVSVNDGVKWAAHFAATSTSSRDVVAFSNPNGKIGAINTDGTTTSYETSSDYRLKENVVEMTGALDRVSQLKPSRFNFIADADKTVDGFLAHEVQEIVPEAISGEKDAVDEEGNPEYQGIDQSKLVPLLVGAIQEQQQLINDLKNRIETLENN